VTSATVEVRTISEFIVAIEGMVTADEVLFRGQRRNDWELAPSIARLHLRRHKTHRQLEQALIESFRRQSPPFVPRDFGNDWELLAMAQHHGLATRLLDWTSNPLAALWFAVREPGFGSEPGCVLALALRDEDHIADRDDASPFTIKKTRFFQPVHLNPRIVAQSGWFSVHYWNGSKSIFARLDHINTYKARIDRLVIPPDAFGDLRFSLDLLGVNFASLFPDLDGLSRHLNWSNSLLADE